jgi:molybdopterin adenylyltransferase
MSHPFTVAILTCSDRCSRGQATDTSGPALARLVQTSLGAQVVAVACVPDEQAQIAKQIKAWATIQPQPDLILTTGGTGLSPRDVTPEATLSVLERRHPGLLELARLRCHAKTPRAFLSRGEAGTIAKTLVINLPGSERGANEMLEALLDILPHALETLRGEVRDDSRPGDVNRHKRVNPEPPGKNKRP